MKLKLPSLKSFDSLAVVLCISAFISIFSLLLYKYNNFGYWDWDLALFSQGMHLISQGKSFVSIYGVNFLGNHANFIAYLLIPFYWLFQSPVFLLFLKSAAFAGSAFMFYVIAKQMLNSARAAIVFLVLFLIYPPNLFAQFFEFDFENIAPLVFLLMFYFFRNNNWLGFCFSALAAILIKENIPLVVGMFGVYGLLTKRPKWLWGLIPMLVGFGTTWVLMKWAIPWFATGSLNSTYSYTSHYAHLGQGVDSIVVNLLTQPGRIVSLFAESSRQDWLLSIFGQFLIFPFLSPQVLMLSAPILFQHFLSDIPQEHTTHFHYTYTLAPFVFLATLQTLSALKKVHRQAYIVVSCIIVILSVCMFYRELPLLKRKFLSTSFASTKYLVPVKYRLLELVPPSEPVLASFCFLQKLSQREQIYSFYKLYMHLYQSFRLPDEVKLALVDLNDFSINQAFLQNIQFSIERLQHFGEQWSPVQAVEDVVLFQKGPPGEKFVVKRSNEQLEEPDKVFNVSIDTQFRLIGMNIGKVRPQERVLPLTFYWQANENIRQQYIIVVLVTKEGKEVFRRVHRVGSALYPTMVWKKGEYIKEQYNLYWPQGDTNNATVSISFGAFSLGGRQIEDATIIDPQLNKSSNLIIAEFPSTGRDGS